jgi:hypothetical protein
MIQPAARSSDLSINGRVTTTHLKIFWPQDMGRNDLAFDPATVKKAHGSVGCNIAG